MLKKNGVLARFRRFALSDAGSVSVEFVIWLPVFFVVFMLIVDAAMLFGGQAFITRVIQDANRSISIGYIRDMNVAEQRVLDAIAQLAPNATAESSITGDVITTTVTLPFSDLASAGPLSLLTTGTMRISAQHKNEV